MTLFQQFTTGLHAIGVKEIWLILSVLLMDVALSGDNSLAINALATRLPQQQRSRVIWYGLGFAALLCVAALCFVSWIAKNPWIQVVGYSSGSHSFGFLQELEDAYSNVGLTIVRNLKAFTSQTDDAMNDALLTCKLVAWLKKE